MSQPDKIVTRCRLCERGLTSTNRLASGRYSCPDCAPTSRTAELGWLPRNEIVLPPSVAKESGLTPMRLDQKMFAHDSDGHAVEREQTCECGRAFTQRLLSERWVRMLEKRSQRALATFEQQIPGGYVPVHCPKCERVDLARQASIAEHRSHYTDRDHEEAAD